MSDALRCSHLHSNPFEKLVKSSVFPKHTFYVFFVFFLFFLFCFFLPLKLSITKKLLTKVREHAAILLVSAENWNRFSSESFIFRKNN